MYITKPLSKRNKLFLEINKILAKPFRKNWSKRIKVAVRKSFKTNTDQKKCGTAHFSNT